MRLLLVEDDTMIGESLQKALKSYAVDWVQTAEAAESSMKTEDYDLLLLDLGLPKQSGLECLVKLRQTGNAIPVLIITARDSVEDRVTGLDCGADDYLLKPFAIEELEARVRALTRRQSHGKNPLISYGGATLNPANYSLNYQGNTERLPLKAFAIMRKLIENPGVIYSKNQLEESIYGWNEEIESNVIEVHIHNIRKKFGAQIITNVRGVGYTFTKVKGE